MPNQYTYSSLEERFWTRVNKTATCWIWTGCISPAGYGRLQMNWKYWQAHRLAYVVTVGPIPDDLVIDHLCRNRACVRPGHMELVTNRENVVRGAGLSACNARKEVCQRGHQFDRLYRGKRSCSECSRIGARRRRQERKEAAAK